VSVLAFIPSPPQGVWNFGPIPIRAYALCILAGIGVAILSGSRRWVARGGLPGTVADIAVWAVPFRIVGGRLYHVISDWELYVGSRGSGWVNAFKIWDGGLGIWGAVVLGGVGAWIGCRRRGIPLPPFADAIAPGIAVAQAMGRFGNWFNQELFGSPTDLPWGLEIDVAHRPRGYEQFATFHPTFLYEAIWCLLVAGAVVWADRRFKLGHGRVFGLYVFLYALGRGVVESMRIDDANHFFGIRLNVFTAVLVALGALVFFVLSAWLRPGREAPDDLLPHPVASGAPAGSGEPDPGRDAGEGSDGSVDP
jgi:prolipoprotein diacylglyceryl transferase